MALVRLLVLIERIACVSCPVLWAAGEALSLRVRMGRWKASIEKNAQVGVVQAVSKRELKENGQGVSGWTLSWSSR